MDVFISYKQPQFILKKEELHLFKQIRYIYFCSLPESRPNPTVRASASHHLKRVINFSVKRLIVFSVTTVRDMIWDQVPPPDIRLLL